MPVLRYRSAGVQGRAVVAVVDVSAQLRLKSRAPARPARFSNKTLWIQGIVHNVKELIS